ncbi:MAG: zinc-ribbon domain-containing protein [Deltaproteobacteria bacterium]|jgi:predicted Zn finger-like uncharacterized protein|nr:zinc-ribbon domain-containing protein [Deltaproteobacteria bacterium]
MIITCAQCHTKFRINAGLIKVTGTRVRCSNCQAVFTVFAPPPRAEQIDVPQNPNQPQPGNLDDLDRELDNFFQNQEPQSHGAPNGDPRYRGAGPGFDPGTQPSRDPGLGYGEGGFHGQGQTLTAIPPKRAENNPINLILGNGDSFVVPDGTNLKPSNDAVLPAIGSRMDLGLGAEPVSSRPLPPLTAGDEVGYDPNQPQFDPSLNLEDNFPDREAAPPLRGKPQKLFSPTQKILLLVLSIVAAGLVIVTLFWSLGGGPASEQPTTQTASVSNGEASASDSLPSPPPSAGDAPSETLRLALPEGSTTNHYIENADAGTILVLTGQVTNEYDRPVDYIRLKAKLMDKDKNILAERTVYAGNVLTEDELKTLAIKEITIRLSLKGGQNGSNTNVDPGKTIRYMFVFNNLPNDLSEYMIEPFSSEFSETASTANPG